ncbi:MAG: efflux RND transporter periplasmic adaptor subunit [Pirellulales bacterium]
MKTSVKILLILLALAGLAAAVYQPAARYWKQRSRPNWRLAKVSRGQIMSVVNSTGTVKPVLSVSVGSFVSGPILELYAKFNQEVKKDQLLAKIDPWIYESAEAREQAALATRVADVERAKAQLQQAINDERRSQSLHKEDPAFISQAEMDKFKFNRMALEAQVRLADASVKQAQASLDNSKANVAYTDIRSPVDGIVIDRKIDPGQTLAAQFQTPELFVVAPNMREKMHVHASVDEADIGLIAQAKRRGLPVTFTVDAYPDDLFRGAIEEIRMSSTTTQSVVTYPVIVATSNSDLKLMPGMTASISFQIEDRPNVLRIPNAALRFYPLANHVRQADRKLLEGVPEADEEESSEAGGLSARQRAELRRKRDRRHVWVVDGDYLRAVPVVTGLSDNQHTELKSGQLKAGDPLVTGIRQDDRLAFQ